MHINTSSQPALDLGFNGYTCNWGAHMCALYQSQEERDQIVLGFMRHGLANGDMCVYGQLDDSLEDFSGQITDQCPECAARLSDPDSFLAPPAKDLYYPDGEFSPWKMEDKLDEFFALSQSHGPRNIRVTADMAWIHQSGAGLDLLMAYESRFNYFIHGKPWIGICLYDVNKFEGGAILNVLRTHPFSIIGGVVTKNPYYQEPDVWLAANAPRYLTRS